MEKFCLDDHCKFFLMLMISILTINECKSNEFDFRDYYFKAHVRPAVNAEVYNDIRRALYFDGSDDALNSFIRRTFDLRTSNPTYMFILPNKKHTTLVMKKSDFKRPIFPSMTKINVKLGRMSAMRLFENDLTYGHLGVTTSILKMSAFDYDHGEDMAQENTQTERNFIDYISRINEKAKELVQSRKMIQSSSFTNYHASYFPIMFRPDDLEWRKFGLFSWKDEVIPSANFNEKIIRKKLPIRDFALERAELHKAGKIEDDSSMIPMQWIFLDDLNDQITWDLPGKIKGANPPTKSQFNEIPKIMKNLLNSSVSPSWPITQPRNEHRNKNVYIARANDPFGYSTKWEFKPKSNVTGSRPKRGVGELYSMLKCSTGCDPLLLKGYGCYCGFLGAGRPADGIDRCCQAHDQCYGRTNCPGYLQYFVPYIWKCYNGRPLCAVDNGEWGRCATQLCKCDLSLSKCARKYRCPRRRAICHSNKLRLLQNYLKVI